MLSKRTFAFILSGLAASCGAPVEREEQEVIEEPLEGCPAPAGAPTAPAAGAVTLPPGVHLSVPFPAGERIRIHAGYSARGGSSLHATTQRSCCANDYYALDLVYDRPDRGFGAPVVAPLAGEVVRAGWATGGWSNYGQRVILRHDLGDGHAYHSLYAHLDRIDPAVIPGARVERGQLLGALGRSCQGGRSCASFSTPHLHFALHRDSAVGGSGTGGSYGGRAVIPEPFDGQVNLRRGQVVVSWNAGGESCEPPPPEPPPPPPSPCEGKINGLWCDGADLIRCTGGQVTSRQTCPAGCRSMPLGINDRCN